MPKLQNILSGLPGPMRDDIALRIADLALNQALDRGRAELPEDKQKQLDALAAKEGLTSQELQQFFATNLTNFSTILFEEGMKVRDEIERQLQEP